MARSFVPFCERCLIRSAAREMDGIFCPLSASQGLRIFGTLKVGCAHERIQNRKGGAFNVGGQNTSTKKQRASKHHFIGRIMGVLKVEREQWTGGMAARHFGIDAAFQAAKRERQKKSLMRVSSSHPLLFPPSHL